MAGSRAIPFHFFPERRSLREAMAVSSPSTSRSRGCCCACHQLLSKISMKFLHFLLFTFTFLLLPLILDFDHV
jgi:hypothetical protein